MGISERRLREKDNVRSGILATAWQLVKDEGWQSLSIRKIAEAIEYSVPVIYDHFENKEAILQEFAKEGFRLLSRKVLLAKEKAGDPVSEIKAIADAYWNFALKNKEYYQLMYGVGMPCCESSKCEGTDGFGHTVRTSIAAAISKGAATDTSVCLKYHTLWSILHGLVSIKIMNNSPDAGELNKLVLDDAIDGFVKNL